MNIKAAASAIAMAVITFGASATSTTPLQVHGPCFADIELASFTVDGLSSVQGTLGFAPYVMISPTIQIALPFVNFKTVSLYNPFQGITTLGSLSGNNFTFTNVPAGTYDLRTRGSLIGTNFVGAEYSVTAVPEPVSVVMLLAGLALVGFFGRRQKTKLI